MKEQHLAAAPFGAWQVLPLSKHRELFARVWPVSLKQKPMLTHGSDCQRGHTGRDKVGPVLKYGVERQQQRFLTSPGSIVGQHRQDHCFLTYDWNPPSTEGSDGLDRSRTSRGEQLG